MSEYKNLFGSSLGSIEEALLRGYSTFLDLPWHCFTDDIQLFIAGAYEVGSNPLPHLRQVFSSFNWKFHAVDPLSPTWLLDVEKAVAQSDYFWPACKESEQWFVTARRKGTDEPPWRILGDGTMLAGTISIKEVGLVEAHPLWPD